MQDAQLRSQRRPHRVQADHRGVVAARLVRVRARSRVRVRDRVRDGVRDRVEDGVKVGVRVRVGVTLAPWAAWHGLEQMGKLSVIA